jgi:hypothetical protein
LAQRRSKLWSALATSRPAFVSTGLTAVDAPGTE